VLGALVLFAFPLAIWHRFSYEVASAGGLYSFVRLAAGPRTAGVHGAIWTVSYFLYLPATVTAVVYELLPELAPGIAPYRLALQLGLPVAFAAAVAVPLRLSLVPVAALAAVQLALVLVVGGIAIAHVGVPVRSFAPHAEAAGLPGATATVSLLFLCASLPLYLGSEVRGGARVVRQNLVGAVVLVGAFVLVAALPLAFVPDRLRLAELPGYAIVGAYAGHGLALAVGAVSVLSILGLVFAEYVALGRLLFAWVGMPLRRSTLLIGGAFLASDAAALLSPDDFYEQALRPSLAALYLSQLIVFGVYPLRERIRLDRFAPAPLVLAGVAAAPMIYGLYLVVGGRIAS
jgi:amino acid transporter